MGLMNAKELKKNGYKIGDKVKKLYVPGDSMAKQEFRQEVDINNLMKRFNAMGYIPAAPAHGVFADVSELGDFGDVLRRVKKGEEAFAALDPAIRLRFRNSPAELMDFLQDPANLKEAVQLGLVVIREESPAPTPAPLTPESTPKA